NVQKFFAASQTHIGFGGYRSRTNRYQIRDEAMQISPFQKVAIESTGSVHCSTVVAAQTLENWYLEPLAGGPRRNVPSWQWWVARFAIESALLVNANSG